MAELGRVNVLKIIEKTDHGLLLDSGDGEPLLLPQRYVTDDMEFEKFLRVFVYKDSEDRPVATTERPLLQVGEAGVLQVTGNHPRAGFFLDWGLSKDLLLPYREQTSPSPEIGEPVVVAVYLDPKSERIAASMRIQRHLSDEHPPFSPKNEVQVVVARETDLGYAAIVEKRYSGLFYASELNAPLEIGQTFTAQVKTVRPDGKIDLLRDASGYGRVDAVTQRILQELEARDGFLPFHDKSPPEAIRETFDTSKKAFKQAVGRLLREKRVEMTPEGLRDTNRRKA
ncbi:MAG: GntR family transcriptional regulator [Opitutales bacterium]|nr:GntR family transcriptional regulator [Opitutales bacterium]MCH8540022.1 hypothetical protein [Opitutales bacterium]